ncbi:MAG: 4Fe-4S dicluster domain-containing protein [Spirochaetaceae bacterium]|jgi:carbon-monoxide dehydrogenase iron sulfur subunit|nr:4Fe-4S dicluster domain-containing protein [Spirochaetaceae bacterium]
MQSIFVDDAKCLGCKTCELACAAAHTPSKNLFAALAANETAQARIYVESAGAGAFPLQCRHCAEAQCAKACVTGALWEHPETGAVKYAEEKCLGCLMCVTACPFGVCAEAQNKKIAKCDLCAGLPQGPACVEACPTGAVRFGSAGSFAKKRRQEYLVQLEREKERA